MREYKSFIRYKRIGSGEYAYQISHYWDEKKKKIRQKSKYLGKVTEEGIKRVRGVVIEKPLRAVDYGDVYVVEEMLKETGLKEILKEVFGERESKKMLVLAINRVIEGVALKDIEEWYEGKYLREIYGEKLGLSSSSLSGFLEKVGKEERLHIEFFLRWWERMGGGIKGIFYDITSLSSASKKINLLEWGYNRDGEKLPQVNVGLVVRTGDHLPLYYKVFPGSIPDVVTLRNLLREVKILAKEKETLLVLDRGFYSGRNLKELEKEGIRFLLPLPFSLKVARKIVSRERRKVEIPENIHRYEGRIIGVVEGEEEIQGVKVHYYLYRDPEREEEERRRFFEKLMEIEEKVEAKELRRGERMKDVVEEIAEKFACYLSFRREGNRIKVKRKNKAISRVLNRMGKEIIISSDILPWDVILHLYQSKEGIERAFRSIKNELEGLPLRVHKEETLRGYLFITFLSLILRSHILERMRESGLGKKLSLNALFLSLRKLRLVGFQKSSHLTEISKKQREILEKLKILMPKN